jgi:hypothetical protein
MAEKVGFSHENPNNKSVDWYTPKWVFDRLGLEFDLDPCAPSKDMFNSEQLKALGVSPSDYDGGVPWIPAKHHYSLVDDGLTQDWSDSLVWLNPPYGKHTGAWLHKMHQHRNGVALVFSRTDCAWYHDSVAKADAILFLKGRVKFVDGLGVTGGSGAGSGSMLIAWGSEAVSALERMADCGHLVYPQLRTSLYDDVI